MSGVAPWGEFVKAKRDEGVELQALLGLVREEGYAVLALFAVGDVYVSLCKKNRLRSI